MSRSADAAVGMMDGAYFVGRKELLDFFNDLLDLKLTKIEQTCTGALACQIADLIFPGSVPVQKINWEARSDYEYVQNYKLLQVAFTKHNVQRHVDVDKLIRGKYQDNLEFCQWLKAFYDQSGCFIPDDYNPTAVRAKGKGGKQYQFNALGPSTAATATARPGMAGRKPVVGGSSPGSRPRPRPAGAAGVPSAAARRTVAQPSNQNSRPGPSSPTNNNVTSRALRDRSAAATNSSSPTDSSSAPTSSSPPAKQQQAQQQQQPQLDLAAAAEQLQIQADAELQQKYNEMETRVSELELAVLEIEKERDFYFEKLRNVEVMLQVFQEKNSNSETKSEIHDALLEKVFTILYATAEDDLTVNDEGEVVPAAELLAAVAAAEDEAAQNEDSLVEA